MKSETNKILESLLKHQGISEFHPLENPEKCDIERQLYGYIKEDFFYFCDAELNNYTRKELNLPIGCALIINIESNTYTIQDSIKGKSIVISSDNLIIDDDAEGFTQIGNDYFFVSPTIDLPVKNESVIANLQRFKQSIQILKPWIEYEIFDYYQKSDQIDTLLLPKIKLGACLFVKNQEKHNLRYLFSQNNKHIFFNTDDETFFLINKTDNYGHCNIETYTSDYLWITGDLLNFINVALIPVDTEHVSEADSIAVTCNGHHSEIKVLNDYGYINTISTEFSPNIEFSNEYFILKYFNSTYYNQAIFCIILNKNGQIVLYQMFEDQNIEYANNLIQATLDIGFSLLDCHGNELARVKSKGGYWSSYDDNVKVEINIENPSIFNEQDVLLHNKTREDYASAGLISKKKDVNTTYQGVIELETGKTLVPLNFSGVITMCCFEPFSEEHICSKQITIVWIDHFYNSKRSYYGLFVNDKMILPIEYDEISFIQYEYYENGKTFNRRKENTQFISIKKGDLVGVLDSWGREILPIEAHNVRCLTEKEDSNYIIAIDKEDYIKIIYKNRIISDYIYTKAEVINLPKIGIEQNECTQIVKLYSEEEIAFVYKGEIRAKFDFDCVTVHRCLVNSNFLSDNGLFVFLEEFDEFKGVLDSNGKYIVPLEEHESIVIRRAFIMIDGVIYGDEMERIVDTNKAELLKSVRVSEGIIRVYYTEDEEYIIFGYNNWVTHTIRMAGDATGVSEEIMGWKYNFENNEFEYETEDKGYNYSDYPDDTDYERDTYYALGGDDYDAFRENGGSIDDMMDGMGL